MKICFDQFHSWNEALLPNLRIWNHSQPWVLLYSGSLPSLECQLLCQGPNCRLTLFQLLLDVWSMKLRQSSTSRCFISVCTSLGVISLCHHWPELRKGVRPAHHSVLWPSYWVPWTWLPWSPPHFILSQSSKLPDHKLIIDIPLF